MKTAVEWLWDELECLIPTECQEAYVKAKEMEKQQITDAFDSDYDYWFTADNYYELKYKK